VPRVVRQIPKYGFLRFTSNLYPQVLINIIAILTAANYINNFNERGLSTNGTERTCNA
jgi:hypothetical protein